MDSETAQTILSVARQFAEHGRELPPHIVAELEAISSSSLPPPVKADAETLLALEVLA
jgi:hypothetical protein